MALTFRTQVAAEATGTSISALMPSPAAVGDIALAFVSSGVVSTFTTPAGWSPVAPLRSTQSQSSQLFYKFLTSSDLSSPVVWNASASAKIVVTLVVYSGVDGVNPISGYADPPTLRTTSSTATLSPSVPGSNLMVQFATSKGTAPGTLTPPAGFTVRSTYAQSGTGSITSAIADSATPQNGSESWATAAAWPQGTVWSVRIAEGVAAPIPDPGTVSHIWVGAQTDSTVKVKAKVSSATSLRLAVSTLPSMADRVYHGPSVPVSNYVSLSAIGLLPGTKYYYQLTDTPTGGNEILIGSPGYFWTMPKAGIPADFSIVAGSCSVTNAADGVGLIDALSQDATLGVHLGDFHYKSLTNTDPAAHVTGYEQQIAGATGMSNFIKNGGASRYSVSDHEAGADNEDSNTAWAAALRVAYDQVVPNTSHDVSHRDQTWKMGRWGHFLADTRTADRSPGAIPQSSNKTMLGSAQLARLLAWIGDGKDAAKVLWSDPAWVGTASLDQAIDKWWAYDHERQKIINAVISADVPFMIVHGDSHTIGYVTPEDNLWGNFPVVCASPYNNVGGGRYLTAMTEYYPTTLDQPQRQYVHLDFTDDGDILKVVATGVDAQADVNRWVFENQWDVSYTPPVDDSVRHRILNEDQVIALINAAVNPLIEQIENLN